MSNDSNRESTRTISPGELQASDFFPPGHGWNRDRQQQLKQDAARREIIDDEAAVERTRQH